MEISARLLMYARHFEDLHAPQNVTEAMREGAGEITALRAEVERLTDALRMIRDHEPERLAWSVGYARAALTPEKDTEA